MRVRLRLFLIIYICLTLLFCSGAAFFPNQAIRSAADEPEGIAEQETDKESNVDNQSNETVEPEAVPEAETESQKGNSTPAKESAEAATTYPVEQAKDDPSQSDSKKDEKESEEETEIVYDSNGEIIKKKMKGIWYVWDDDYGYREEVRLLGERKVDASKVSEEKAQIKMTCVYQLPEYPTGCEITASYMILKYYHFPISKVRFGNKYFGIHKGAEVDFRYYFAGDPYTEYGLGCYSPAVTIALNNYFKVCESDFRAYNYTGYSFESLLNEVAEGHPVILWATQYMKEPFYGSYFKFGDEIVRWVSQEHCLVLGGYNLKNKTAYMYDPLAGPVEYDIDTVKKRFLQLGSQAVIVRDKDDYYDRRNKPLAFRDDPNLPKR